MILTLASIITAVAIAYTGIIGFIGMIVPQLIRRYYWRFTLGIQMILNILIGATMMLIADWIGSVLIHPVQIPASIILALIGIQHYFTFCLSNLKIFKHTFNCITWMLRYYFMEDFLIK